MLIRDLIRANFRTIDHGKVVELRVLYTHIQGREAVRKRKKEIERDLSNCLERERSRVKGANCHVPMQSER